MSIVEKAIALISPRWAATRARDRVVLGQVNTQVRKYDGASSSRRTASWRGTGASTNAENLFAVDRLRNGAREAERNNAWAKRGIQGIVSNTIGMGIRCQVKAKAKPKADRAARRWREWAESTACDFEGERNFAALQALAMATTVRDGEVLVRVRREKGGPVPIRLQLIECDFLDNTRTIGEAGRRVIAGIEIDDDGRKLAYWLWPNHPGDPFGMAMQSIRVPKDQIIHLYDDTARPGQLRGVSWLSSILLGLYDLDEFEDAELMRHKIASCFAVFVHDAAGADPLVADATNPEATIDRLEPGIIEHLPAGKQIQIATPPTAEGFTDFQRAVLRKIAAGFGITYEVLTGDYSQTNFSSGRMGWIEFGRNIEAWQYRLFIPKFCMAVWAHFAEAATLMGEDMAGVTAEWTPPRRALINPKEELAAMVLEVRAGLNSWEEIARERGWDPEVLAEQIKRSNELFDRLDLTLDCDPRKTTAQGQAKENEAAAD